MTTKAEAERTITEVDVLCDLAAMMVRSHAPTGLLSARDCEAVDEMLRQLEEIPVRFEKLVAKAQKKGWAAE